jgi:hypothetical protein
MFADWTDRIAEGRSAAGAAAAAGLERNVVITQWDWADQKAYCTTKCRPIGATRR